MTVLRGLLLWLSGRMLAPYAVACRFKSCSATFTQVNLLVFLSAAENNYRKTSNIIRTFLPQKCLESQGCVLYIDLAIKPIIEIPVVLLR